MATSERIHIGNVMTITKTIVNCEQYLTAYRLIQKAVIFRRSTTVAQIIVYSGFEERRYRIFGQRYSIVERR